MPGLIAVGVVGLFIVGVLIYIAVTDAGSVDA